MDDLVVRVGDGRLRDEVLQHVAVLDFAHAEDGVIDLVVVLHRTDDRGHVVKLLLVLHLSPLVGSVRKILVVVLPFVVIGVEEVLQVVEPYDMAPLHFLGTNERHQKEKGSEYAE